MDFEKEHININDKKFISFLSLELKSLKKIVEYVDEVTCHRCRQTFIDAFECDTSAINTDCRNECFCCKCYVKFNLCHQCNTSFNSARCPSNFGCQLLRTKK